MCFVMFQASLNGFLVKILLRQPPKTVVIISGRLGPFRLGFSPLPKLKAPPLGQNKSDVSNLSFHIPLCLRQIQLERGRLPKKKHKTPMRYVILICWCMYIYIPGSQMTSIFLRSTPAKTRPFPIKTSVIWVPGICIMYIKRYAPEH